jgi:hypothetical protein
MFTVTLHSHNLRTCHATVTWPVNSMTIKYTYLKENVLSYKSLSSIGWLLYTRMFSL